MPFYTTALGWFVKSRDYTSHDSDLERAPLLSGSEKVLGALFFRSPSFRFSSSSLSVVTLRFFFLKKK